MEWNEISCRAKISLETFDQKKLNQSSNDLLKYISEFGKIPEAICLKKRIDEMLELADRFKKFRK